MTERPTGPGQFGQPRQYFVQMPHQRMGYPGGMIVEGYPQMYPQTRPIQIMPQNGQLVNQIQPQQISATPPFFDGSAYQAVSAQASQIQQTQGPYAQHYAQSYFINGIPWNANGKFSWLLVAMTGFWSHQSKKAFETFELDQAVELWLVFWFLAVVLNRKLNCRLANTFISKSESTNRWHTNPDTNPSPLPTERRYTATNPVSSNNTKRYTATTAVSTATTSAAATAVRGTHPTTAAANTTTADTNTTATHNTTTLSKA
jgi:hypothetical protein